MNVCVCHACYLCWHELAITMCPDFVTCSTRLKCNQKCALALTLLNTIARKCNPCISSLVYLLSRSPPPLRVCPCYCPHIGQHKVTNSMVSRNTNVINRSQIPLLVVDLVLLIIILVFTKILNYMHQGVSIIVLGQADSTILCWYIVLCSHEDFLSVV